MAENKLKSHIDRLKGAAEANSIAIEKNRDVQKKLHEAIGELYGVEKNADGISDRLSSGVEEMTNGVEEMTKDIEKLGTLDLEDGKAVSELKGQLDILDINLDGILEDLRKIQSAQRGVEKKVEQVEKESQSDDALGNKIKVDRHAKRFGEKREVQSRFLQDVFADEGLEFRTGGESGTQGTVYRVPKGSSAPKPLTRAAVDRLVQAYSSDLSPLDRKNEVSSLLGEVEDTPSKLERAKDGGKEKIKEVKGAPAETERQSIMPEADGFLPLDISGDPSISRLCKIEGWSVKCNLDTKIVSFFDKNGKLVKPKTVKEKFQDSKYSADGLTEDFQRAEYLDEFYKQLVPAPKPTPGDAKSAGEVESIPAIPDKRDVGSGAKKAVAVSTDSNAAVVTPAVSTAPPKSSIKDFKAPPSIRAEKVSRSAAEKRLVETFKVQELKELSEDELFDQLEELIADRGATAREKYIILKDILLAFSEADLKKKDTVAEAVEYQGERYVEFLSDRVEASEAGSQDERDCIRVLKDISSGEEDPIAVAAYALGALEYLDALDKNKALAYFEQVRNDDSLSKMARAKAGRLLGHLQGEKVLSLAELRSIAPRRHQRELIEPQPAANVVVDTAEPQKRERKPEQEKNEAEILQTMRTLVQEIRTLDEEMNALEDKAESAEPGEKKNIQQQISNKEKQFYAKIDLLEGVLFDHLLLKQEAMPAKVVITLLSDVYTREDLEELKKKLVAQLSNRSVDRQTLKTVISQVEDSIKVLEHPKDESSGVVVDARGRVTSEELHLSKEEAREIIEKYNNDQKRKYFKATDLLRSEQKRIIQAIRQTDTIDAVEKLIQLKKFVDNPKDNAEEMKLQLFLYKALEEVEEPGVQACIDQIEKSISDLERVVSQMKGYLDTKRTLPEELVRAKLSHEVKLSEFLKKIEAIFDLLSQPLREKAALVATRAGYFSGDSDSFLGILLRQRQLGYGDKNENARLIDICERELSRLERERPEVKGNKKAGPPPIPRDSVIPGELDEDDVGTLPVVPGRGTIARGLFGKAASPEVGKKADASPKMLSAETISIIDVIIDSAIDRNDREAIIRKLKEIQGFKNAGVHEHKLLDALRKIDTALIEGNIAILAGAAGSSVDAEDTLREYIDSSVPFQSPEMAKFAIDTLASAGRSRILGEAKEGLVSGLGRSNSNAPELIRYIDEALQRIEAKKPGIKGMEHAPIVTAPNLSAEPGGEIGDIDEEEGNEDEEEKSFGEVFGEKANQIKAFLKRGVRLLFSKRVIRSEQMSDKFKLTGRSTFEVEREQRALDVLRKGRNKRGVGKGSSRSEAAASTGSRPASSESRSSSVASERVSSSRSKPAIAASQKSSGLKNAYLAGGIALGGIGAGVGAVYLSTDSPTQEARVNEPPKPNPTPGGGVEVVTPQDTKRISPQAEVKTSSRAVEREKEERLAGQIDILNTFDTWEKGLTWNQSAGAGEARIFSKDDAPKIKNGLREALRATEADPRTKYAFSDESRKVVNDNIGEAIQKVVREKALPDRFVSILKSYIAVEAEEKARGAVEKKSKSGLAAEKQALLLEQEFVKAVVALGKEGSLEKVASSFENFLPEPEYHGVIEAAVFARVAGKNIDSYLPKRRLKEGADVYGAIAKVIAEGVSDPKKAKDTEVLRKVLVGRELFEKKN